MPQVLSSRGNVLPDALSDGTASSGREAMVYGLVVLLCWVVLIRLASLLVLVSPVLLWLSGSVTSMYSDQPPKLLVVMSMVWLPVTMPPCSGIAMVRDESPVAEDDDLMLRAIQTGALVLDGLQVVEVLLLGWVWLVFSTALVRVLG